MRFKQAFVYIGTAALALGWAGSAAAAPIGAGDVEVRGSLSMISSKAFDTTSAQVGFGYLITDAIQLSADLNVVRTEMDEVCFGAECVGGTETSGTLGLGADYLFGAIGTGLIPFVGLSYATNLGEGDVTDYYTLRGGAKLFVTDRAFIDGRYEFQGATDSEKGDDQTLLYIGVGVYF